MTCLPCLRLRRMVELCRSSTAVRNTQRSPPTSIIENVELLQSSNTSHTTVRQGSRFAPTLPYQEFNPFGVGELRGDGRRVLPRRMGFDTQRWVCGFTQVLFLARRDAEDLEYSIFDAEGKGLGERRAYGLRRNRERRQFPCHPTIAKRCSVPSRCAGRQFRNIRVIRVKNIHTRGWLFHAGVFGTQRRRGFGV